jgi:hypothetical protein
MKPWYNVYFIEFNFDDCFDFFFFQNETQLLNCKDQGSVGLQCQEACSNAQVQEVFTRFFGKAKVEINESVIVL